MIHASQYDALRQLRNYSICVLMLRYMRRNMDALRQLLDKVRSMSSYYYICVSYVSHTSIYVSHD
jgi:hypothetical protein